MRGDIRPILALPALPFQVFEPIPSVLKAVHDVGAIRGVLEANSMTGLVQACQIHDRIAEQSSFRPAAAICGPNCVRSGCTSIDAPRLPLMYISRASP